MRKHLAVLILALFAVVAVVGVVGPAAARGPMDKWWGSSEGYPTSASSEQPLTKCTITGLVERTDNGLALVTSGGREYILTGKDLSREVGEEVTVTGELSKMVGEKPEIKVKSSSLA